MTIITPEEPKTNDIQLSDHFSYRRLLKFTLPSMVMMFVTSVYGIVDGMMVSNFAGTTPFASLNLIWPFVAVLGAVGFMFGTGGSALVAKTRGRGDEKKANDIFSLLTYTALILSTILGILGTIFVRDIAILMGAQGIVIDYCQNYGSILLLMLPSYVMQVYFQSFLITAERPKMGMWITIAAGVTNMLLDYLFIAVWGWGLCGAAWATATSQVLGGFVPLVYFIFKRNDPRMTLKLGRCSFSKTALMKTMSNGISEFVMSISLSLVSMLYMYQLLREAGENGVAAYGIMMYFAFSFAAIFIGYGIGSTPVVSFHFGAENKVEIKSLLRKSLAIVVVLGILLTLIAQNYARTLASIFVGYDQTLLNLTTHAFKIYSLHLIVTGVNFYASAFFTALNNGPVSALISLLRTLVFEAGCVLVLPMLFGIEGIWWSVLVAEALTMLASFALLGKYKKRYGY